MTADYVTKYGPWALVIGASDGVGSQFAGRLAHEGVNVVLAARRQHVLDEVAQPAFASAPTLRPGRLPLT